MIDVTRRSDCCHGPGVRSVQNPLDMKESENAIHYRSHISSHSEAYHAAVQRLY
jgi:hypothetical protein